MAAPAVTPAEAPSVAGSMGILLKTSCSASSQCPSGQSCYCQTCMPSCPTGQRYNCICQTCFKCSPGTFFNVATCGCEYP
jgi:hypothetical protein